MWDPKYLNYGEYLVEVVVTLTGKLNFYVGKSKLSFSVCFSKSCLSHRKIGHWKIADKFSDRVKF